MDKSFEKTDTIHGILYGEHSRSFVSLVVSRPNFNEYYNVFFLIDTGSPYTCMTNEVFGLFGIKQTDCPSDQVIMKINGDKIKTGFSDKHYKDINLLGTDFLKLVGAKLTVDYDNNTTEIKCCI